MNGWMNWSFLTTLFNIHCIKWKFISDVSPLLFHFLKSVWLISDPLSSFSIYHLQFASVSSKQHNKDIKSISAIIILPALLHFTSLLITTCAIARFPLEPSLSATSASLPSIDHDSEKSKLSECLFFSTLMIPS